MNTALAAKVMQICVARLKRPDWVAVGQTISSAINRDDKRSAEAIADEVIEICSSR